MEKSINFVKLYQMIDELSKINKEIKVHGVSEIGKKEFIKLINDNFELIRKIRLKINNWS